ncbi:MAG: radical SAM protein [Isosphaeraceae bacterium]
MKLHEHTFLGTTQSLCPECLALVPAKIITKGRRVYFRKTCGEHGVRDDFVCSDVAWYDQMQYSLPGKIPENYGTEPDKGCPYDCGLCTEHEQHTCVGLLEMTTSCNLKCPMCFASSGPGGEHLSFDECKAAIDRLVAAEGRPEVLQLSGGEPTIHPEFARVLDYACRQPIDVVMVNTNGLRLAHDPAMVELLASKGPQLEVYFQFDGFSEASSTALRGESLVETKLKAIEALGRAGVRVTLVMTLQGGVNEHEVGDVVRFGLERRWISGISLQPATYSGRHVLPEDLERRVTFPDVIRSVVKQTNGLFHIDDFLPLPCAHPNCHTLTYAFRPAGGPVVPLTRFIDARNHLEILANGILFSRERARGLIASYLGKLGCCGHELPGRNGDAAAETDEAVARASADFFGRALNQTLTSADVFRITITSFLDAYNFDVRRLMKCCIHHVLPGGHIIPFCAYNVLYREGHVVLPALRQAAGLNVVSGPLG